MTICRTVKKSNYLTYIRTILILVLAAVFLPGPPLTAQGGKRPLALRDIMKFRAIRDTVISEKGDWVAYNMQPDRGNGSVVAVHTKSRKSYTIQRGVQPVITKDSSWLAATILPDFMELERLKEAAKKKKNGKKEPEKGLTLLNTKTGTVINIDRVKAFSFSDDSGWLFYYLHKVKKEGEENKEKKDETNKKTPKELETFTLVLHRLPDGKETRIEKARTAAFDRASRYLAYSVYDKENGKRDGLYVIDLKERLSVSAKVHGEPLGLYSNLAWSKTKSRLAFIFHKKTNSDNKDKTAKQKNLYSSVLMMMDGSKNKLRSLITKEQLPTGWLLPAGNNLSWSEDENRLFFGFKPLDEYLWTRPVGEQKNAGPGKSGGNPYDINGLLKKGGVEVWHWNDPLINPHQKMEWNNYKARVYTAVYLLKEDRHVRLADKEMPGLVRPENPDYALGFSDLPYLREITWDDEYKDIYYVNLRNGARQKILTRLQGKPSLSFHGGYVVYYKKKHWHLYNIRSGTTRNLTASIKTPFFNEDHDYPKDVPGYGLAGWTENDQSVLIYDKYDIWEFFTEKGGSACLTGGVGRENQMVFRVNKLDPKQKFFRSNEGLLLSAYSDKKKYTGFYRGSVGKSRVKKLLEQPDRTFRFVKKAEKASQFLYTRENFEEFPDLWLVGIDFKSPRKISDANPQRKNFLWGKSELMEWDSLDGRRLQGVVIKPENYDRNKRYPVLIYFYRFFSTRLHEFNEVVINHRPCFPYYSGSGYVIFLPDIRFEVGRPGFSSTKSLVPGVQKLISVGIADPKAIGLHGHSWSGYQAAYMITQTDIFTAAVAGAPVSNMTSAYNGIRWGSGQARQFQYEKSQSRIGATLVESPHLYIENSPVFFVDRINTPLLIQHGDKDGAVPWYQSIELYLAMRRLDKNCIFLQYHDEPHHLKQYPNKLDYTIRMKQFFDHYLRGKPAPKWMKKGTPYRKK
ncbi:MAG: S9 family peptidase [bacterium]|nr:S9 family peptidase [bacterium]